MTAMTHPTPVRGSDGIARYPDPLPNLVAALRITVERVPDAEAVVQVGGPRLTYAQLWDRATALAAGLAGAGVRPGDRVGILLPNGVDWCAAFFAVQLAGCVAVPINTRLSEPEISHITENAGLAYVFDLDHLPTRSRSRRIPEAAPDDPAAIFYTSGTTGRPKGATTTHANFLANIENARRLLGVTEPWVSLVSVPLFHVTGCNSQLLPSVATGGTLVILPQFDGRSMLRAIESEAITALMSVPTMYRMLLGQTHLDRYRLGSVRSITFGGSPMPRRLIPELRELFPRARLGNGYGLTESASFCTYLPDDQVDEHPDSVGFAAPVVDLRLDDPRGTGVGELLVRGPNVVAGYWNDPAATAKAFEDGWLRTGDIAAIDDRGLVRIVDRAKDVIIRGGENVYSAEVERALAEHPSVREVAVTGVPDSIAGEKVAAAIVLVPGEEDQLREVFRSARKELARYKMPELVAVYRTPLPRNPGGKVIKSLLRTAAWMVAPR
ncbi:class I adenylate-forming enzyme family protein [Nocardia sp. NPDC056000]|uniref:class I adenylate-forming enzyme family protein n=1 Tax=Nocardia sp. NPDC056000 TaxID=3345674 RepID=UPI0035D5EEE0